MDNINWILEYTNNLNSQTYAHIVNSLNLYVAMFEMFDFTLKNNEYNLSYTCQGGYWFLIIEPGKLFVSLFWFHWKFF